MPASRLGILVFITVLLCFSLMMSHLLDINKYFCSCRLQSAGIETVFSGTLDTFPRLRRWKPLVCLVICAVQFLLGLSMCTQVGHRRRLIVYTGRSLT